MACAFSLCYLFCKSITDFSKKSSYRCGQVLEAVPQEYKSGCATTRAKEWSETAVIAITRGTSENFDNLAVKGEFYLTDEEDNLIRQVGETFENTVLLINSGYPMDVRCVEKYGTFPVPEETKQTLNEMAKMLAGQTKREKEQTNEEVKQWPELADEWIRTTL